MSRSRSLNRSNRLTAKRRRRVLRSVVPALKEDLRGIVKPVNHSQALILKDSTKEALVDLMDQQIAG